MRIDTGFGGLTEKCPQCSHSPITPDSCIPHKSLRRTIRVFVSKKEKKLEGSKSTGDAAGAAGTDEAPTPTTPQPGVTVNTPGPALEASQKAENGVSVPGNTVSTPEESSVVCHKDWKFV